MTPASQETMDLIRQALGEEYISLGVFSILVEDNMYGQCFVRIQLKNGPPIEGVGIGQVDATFNAFITHYAEEYQSLRSIELSKFNVRICKATSKNADKLCRGLNGSDARCEVELEIKNSWGNYFNFSSAAHSLTAATSHAIASAVEFFLNSERAFRAVYVALTDARERNRTDLITRYTRELSVLVKSTSYAKTIERLVQDSGL